MRQAIVTKNEVKALQIEDAAIALADHLTNPGHVELCPSRDLLGTLHCNLSVVIARATRLRDALERKHGFVHKP